MELILGILGIIVWLLVTSIVMFITLTICGISLFIGAIGGMFIGFFKGLINYFAAVREELKFSHHS
ncbi:MAG: hypothetical protein IJX87_02750 [Clostridia bacterium]|nr:hypothetical protein [Clostridia bacterium]